MQIAIKNLPYQATNLLPSLIHLTLDKLSQMASSLGPYDLLVVSYNMLKVLDLGQSGILLYILKYSYVPPIKQEAEVIIIFCLLHPPILDKIGIEKWLAVKVNQEFCSHYITNNLTVITYIGHQNFYNIARKGNFKYFNKKITQKYKKGLDRGI